MTTPTIQEIVDAAHEKVIKYGKGDPTYRLSIFQQMSTRFDNGPRTLAMWHLEYYGLSLQQPFICVTNVTPDGLLHRFEMELSAFTPLSMEEVEELNKVKA